MIHRRRNEKWPSVGGAAGLTGRLDDDGGMPVVFNKAA
jgi:hypothetical protein